ncbi:c-type cytochrome biogenesis protein CcsB, partial [Escherichia coli]
MNTTTFDLPRRHALQRRDTLDWVFAALVLLGGGYAFQRYQASMNVYEQGILLCTLPALIALG